MQAWRSFLAAAAIFAFALPARAAEEPIGVLLAAGDIAKCKPWSARDEATAAVVAREVAAANARGIPVRVLALGDLAYDKGTAKEFSCFDASWGAFKPIMLPVPGNHEYSRSNPDAAPYFEYFAVEPQMAGVPLVESNGERAGYYALSFPDPQSGPWRLIALNAYARASPGAIAGQLEWLRRDLETNRAPCVLALWHPYVLSSGRHGHDDGKSETLKLGRAMVEAFGILKRAGASVVLSGHDHDFEQFARHDEAGHRDAQGVRSFVVGTGGGQASEVENTSRWAVSEKFTDDTYGVLRIDLFADRYAWDFLPVDGFPDIDLPTTEDSCVARTPPA
jgi:hypothetical protein